MKTHVAENSFACLHFAPYEFKQQHKKKSVLLVHSPRKIVYTGWAQSASAKRFEIL